jgi:superfamily II DNA or RNA helicase
LILRPYQADGLRKIRVALDSGERSVLYVLPTGGGKTVMFATMARSLASRKERVLILVHRREIMEQTLASLFRLGVTSGQIAAGHPVTQDSIQVGMVQTVVRRLGSMRRPDLIVLDEAHHVLADNSYGTIIQYWREVPRVGFTATPERLDGRGLGESFGAMIEGPSIRTLVESGYLAPPVLYRPPNELLTPYHVRRGDFDEGEQERAMSGRKIIGDVIDHYRAHLDGLPVVCFCVSIAHSRLMARQFAEAGYEARVVWGNMPKSEREAAIKGLADGSVQVVTSCDVISEGVDVPVMAGAILLRRTLSLGLYLQQAGRALRLSEGKRQAVILDHAGNYQLHGHVLQDRVWSLEAKARRERGEEPPTTTTCPACYGVWPGRPRTCPACGFDFSEMIDGAARAKDVRVIAGELVAAGLPGDDADSLAGMYADAMKADPAERARMLAKRGVKMLREAAGYSERPTDEAWRYRRETERMDG